MKKNVIKYLVFFVLLFLIATIALTGCKKINIPNLNTFSEEIKEEYPEVQSLKPYVYNTPTLSIYIRGKEIDNKVKEEIAVKTVEFILSDAGYEEMVQYYIARNRIASHQFSDIYIIFIDTEYDEDKDRIRYNSTRDSDIAVDDIENKRGFLEWAREDLENYISEKIDIFSIE